jgi:SAM-dependent methyltransferase
LLLILQRIRRGPFPSRATAQPEPPVHPFDKQYGTDTSGLIWGERIVSDHRNSYWATGYSGISPSVFRQALDRLDLDWTRFTFVDVGSGKGRALMLALHYPFQRVIGIELSADLARISKRNLAHFSAERPLCAPVEVVEADAVVFPLPLEPLVIFLFHPFAQPVMVSFLEHLRSSLQERPREVYLVYADPQLSHILSSAGFLSKLWDEPFAMTPEDSAADYFGREREHISVYRSH